MQYVVAVGGVYYSGQTEDLQGRLKSGVSDTRDNDKLANFREDEIGTDKNNPDTDGDGLNDGPEMNIRELISLVAG